MLRQVRGHEGQRIIALSALEQHSNLIDQLARSSRHTHVCITHSIEPNIWYQYQYRTRTVPGT
jgi:hypothetical protein